MGITETLCYYNTQFIHSCSYFGVFVLMALESMIAPIPSELVMPFAGFLIFTGQFNPWALMLAWRQSRFRSTIASSQWSSMKS